MERRNGEKVKNWAMFVGISLTALSVIVGIFFSMSRLSSTKKQLENAKAIELSKQQKSDKEMFNKISLNTENINDNKYQLNKIEIESDKNSAGLSRIKDSLIIFPTKEEVNAKFANFSTTLKTDVMTSNAKMSNFNQRISYLEGSWQLWIVNYYHTHPDLTPPVKSVPLDNKIYNSEMYK